MSINNTFWYDPVEFALLFGHKVFMLVYSGLITSNCRTCLYFISRIRFYSFDRFFEQRQNKVKVNIELTWYFLCVTEDMIYKVIRPNCYYMQSFAIFWINTLITLHSILEFKVRFPNALWDILDQWKFSMKFHNILLWFRNKDEIK